MPALLDGNKKGYVCTRFILEKESLHERMRIYSRGRCCELANRMPLNNFAASEEPFGNLRG